MYKISFCIYLHPKALKIRLSKVLKRNKSLANSHFLLNHLYYMVLAPLFTGDLVYKDILFAYYPSTDPEAYLDSLEKVAALPVKKVFPAHHSLDIEPEILIRMREAFRNLKADGKLHHGSGTFDYGDWGVWL